MPLKNRMAILLGGLAVAAVVLLVFRPASGIRVAFDAEFHTRPDGYQGLCRHYGFEFPEEPLQLETGLMYRVLADGAVDVIDAFATDGRITAYDLLVLDDDQGFFPPYDAALEKANLWGQVWNSDKKGSGWDTVVDNVIEVINKGNDFICLDH